MKWNRKAWLIATSEKPDNFPVKKVYKKKHWRNVNGEIVNTKNLLNFCGVVTGNTMRVFDYNDREIAKLYYW